MKKSEPKKKESFWDSVWDGHVGRATLRTAIKDYHAETVRMILALSGEPSNYAKAHVLVDEAEGNRSLETLSDQVHRGLGSSDAMCFRARSAGWPAIYSRRHAYSAAIFDPKYDELSAAEFKEFFRKCMRRAEWDLCEVIENAAMVAGEGINLGRP